MEKLSEEAKERRKDGIRVRLPGGAEIQLGGYNVFTTLILVIVCVLAFILWDHREVSAAAINEIKIGQIKQEEALHEMTYVFTLSPEQREKLKLDMPQSLKRKIRHREPE